MSNSQWASSFALLAFLDFGVFEIVAIIVSTIILKKVGQHPENFGKYRDYVIKYGPRAIRSATVTFGEEEKKKKEKKEKRKRAPGERKIKREKK